MSGLTRTGLVLAALLAAAPAVAQPRIERDPAQLATEISARRAEAERALREYSWRERTEFQKGKEPQHWAIVEVTHDADGEPQHAPVPAPPPRKPGKKPKKAKPPSAKERKRQDAFRALLDEYSLPTEGALAEFLGRATIGSGDIPGTTRIRSRDVVRPGDELTLWVDTATKRLRRTKALTTLDKHRASVEVVYQRLESGLVYKARETVEDLKSHETMTVERFDLVNPDEPPADAGVVGQAPPG